MVKSERSNFTIDDRTVKSN